MLKTVETHGKAARGENARDLGGGDTRKGQRVDEQAFLGKRF